MKDIRTSLVAFYVLTPLLTVARILQQFLLIDAETGFYTAEGEFIAKIISWTFLGAFVIILLLAFLTPKICFAAPKKSTPLGIVSFALAAALFFDSAKMLMNIGGGKLNLVVAIFGALSAVSFVMYGLSHVAEIKFPTFLALFPVFWATVDLIAQFMRYTGQSSIIDYTVSTVTMCLVLYTLLTHSKIVIGEVSRKLTVAIIGTGLAASLFCLINTVPTVIATVMGKANTLIHDKSIATPTIFVMAIYLIVFIHSLKKVEPTLEIEETDEETEETEEVEEETTSIVFETTETEITQPETTEEEN